MDVHHKNQTYRLVQGLNTFVAVGMEEWGESGRGWVNTDVSDPLGSYFMASTGCEIQGWFWECNRPILMATNLTAGNYLAVPDVTAVINFVFNEKKKETNLNLDICCGCAASQEIVGTSVTNNQAEKYSVTLSGLTNILSASDKALLSTKESECFQDNRCSGSPKQKKTLYNIMHHLPGRYMANQNAANVYGELYYLYSSYMFINNQSLVTQYENVILDTRWRAYEPCNPMGSEATNPFRCERSSFYSPLGVGFATFDRNFTIEYHSCNASATGIEWYSLNALGNGKTYDFSDSVNTTIAWPCLEDALNPIWKIHQSQWPPVELYPKLEKAFLEAFTTCQHL
jgi:hypothetical protein